MALGPANRVAVVDAQTFEVEKYLLVGQRVWQLAFSPDQKWLYSTNGVSNDISVIDVDNLEVVKSVTTGAYPWGVVVRDGIERAGREPSRPADLNSPCLMPSWGSYRLTATPRAWSSRRRRCSLPYQSYGNPVLLPGQR